MDPTGEYGVKKIFSVIVGKMAQPETGGVRKTEGEDNADIRNVNIRDEQSENTQREDLLLPTEPSYGLALRMPLSEMWWTVAAVGEAMPTRRLAGRENLLRIRCIRHLRLVKQTVITKLPRWLWSPN